MGAVLWGCGSALIWLLRCTGGARESSKSENELLLSWSFQRRRCGAFFFALGQEPLAGSSEAVVGLQLAPSCWWLSCWPLVWATLRRSPACRGTCPGSFRSFLHTPLSRAAQLWQPGVWDGDTATPVYCKQWVSDWASEAPQRRHAQCIR